MQIDLLTSDTVKITLDLSDMASYGISFEDISAKKHDSVLLLSKLISEIKESCRVGLSGERLLVEAFPKTDGGCMLYISCLGSADGGKNKKAQKPVKQSEYIITESCSLDNIAALCNILKRRRCIIGSSLYYYNNRSNSSSGKSVYRLCFFGRQISGYVRAAISEYCEPVGFTEAVMHSTDEYFTKLCDNAINTISDCIG